MYHAKAIAGTFNELAHAEGKILTHTQLSRLVYIAHGWCLGVFDRALISDAVYAMQTGPIMLAMNYIEQAANVESAARLSVALNSRQMTEATSLIEAVYACYRSFSGYQLGLLTCVEDSPWAKVWNGGKGENLAIPNKIIREYYMDIVCTRAGIPVVA